jgi:hypothetical protein
MTSREWIQHLHVRFSEIVRVSADDDEIVDERCRCNQAVLYRHRFTGLAQLSQKLRPSKARQRVPWNTNDSRDTLIKPGFESTTSFPRGQKMNAEANLTQNYGIPLLRARCAATTRLHWNWAQASWPR